MIFIWPLLKCSLYAVLQLQTLHNATLAGVIQESEPPKDAAAH